MAKKEIIVKESSEVIANCDNLPQGVVVHFVLALFLGGIWPKAPSEIWSSKMSVSTFARSHNSVAPWLREGMAAACPFVVILFCVAIGIYTHSPQYWGKR